MKNKHSVTKVFLGEIICWDMLYKNSKKKSTCVFGVSGGWAGKVGVG